MLKNYYAIIFVLLLMPIAWAQKKTDPAVNSGLTGARLPANALRVREEFVPAQINDALRKMVDTGAGKIRQGDSETLVWMGGNYRKSNAAGLIQKVTDGLQTAGWTYEVGGTDGSVTIFSLFKAEPTRRAVVGFYTADGEALVLAWTEILAVNSNAEPIVKTPNGETRPTDVHSGATILNVAKTAQFVNVMGNEMPALPKFPASAPKPGRVSGYVKDASGKPLTGATIGVRSTYIGGAYSGAQGTTDKNGYYEFAIPKGVAHFYNAGYAVEWGDGLAALSLHPADGKIESFASVDGAVENFVLLSYGITSRENVSQNPRLSSTYYGGTIYIGHWTCEGTDCDAQPTNIPLDAVVEITLTPEGELFDGTAGRSFVVRKPAFSSGFKINNIPVGRYKIGAKLANGKALKLKLNKPSGSIFGMTPAETTGSASVLFQPGDARATMVGPQYGSWDSVEIYVEKP